MKKLFQKKNFTTILLILIMLAGMAIMAYPAFSNYWNSLHQSKAIATYNEAVGDLSEDEYAKIIAEAEEYNKKLAKKGTHFELSESEQKEYNSVLDITGTGIMGYIEIQKIGCSLPIYHGTDEGVMQVAIGHIPGTSLPIGGKTAHSVLSGHRGLPSAKLFTDLDKLEKGDTFIVRVLNESYTYQVDQVLIVEPQEVDSLYMQKGKDYCTLVTCTPYGVNTHRLLVRGHKIKNASDVSSAGITADGLQIKPIIVTPVIAAPILLALMIYVLADSRRRRIRRLEAEEAAGNIEKDE